MLARMVCCRSLIGPRLVLIAVVSACLAALIPPAAQAGVANAGLRPARAADPLSGLRWGDYSGPLDEVFPAYRRAGGSDRRLLGEIALRPRVRWFGAWYSDAQAERTARQYIANVTGGNPNVLAQMAVFRLVPWEAEACHRLPTAAEQASYERWIRAFAAGIGSARVALILQPDLPFALCVPHRSRLPLHLVAYAAGVFAALPHATVYIDAGAADWPSVGEAAAILRSSGVRYARGFALDATHYDATASEIRFGQQVVRKLTAAGVPGRHFVINTAENGRPFTYQHYGDASTYDNAPVCPSHARRGCVALGIPPTWDVASPRWHLSARVRAIAARYVDAYLWIGRPWLEHQADPFDLARALALARANPF
ncbi:MAG: endoglucanase [Solirubrobacteraceae bacterium]|jgi:endoglucanase|nr:endoglucanase [Solirubrobacteraceae bacterium]